MGGVRTVEQMYNEEYERSLLGILLMENTIYEKVNIEMEAKHLYNTFYKKVYMEIGKMLSEGEEANIVSLSAKFPEKASKIASLTDYAFGSPDFYAKEIREMAIRRTIKYALKELLTQIDDKTKNVAELVEDVETRITESMERKEWSYKKVEDTIISTVEQIETLYHNGGYMGLPSGYRNLDSYTGGFQRGEVTVIGARASIGKTAFALNVAENIVKRGIPAGFISLEMSATLLLQRMLCGNSGVSLRSIRTGHIGESDLVKLTEVAGSIYQYPMYIYDSPRSSLTNIKLNSRKMRRQNKVELICVDYVGLIQGKEGLPRWEMVGKIFAELKELARELDIPLLVCSQVNRDAEGKPPTLANLRESGAIEQDADVVLFLHRDRDKTECDLYIAKNRNGGTGKLKMMFKPERTRFYEMEKGGDNGQGVETAGTANSTRF